MHKYNYTDVAAPLTNSLKIPLCFVCDIFIVESRLDLLLFN